MFELNFQPGFPSQSTDFTIGASTFTARVRWNERFLFWSLSLYNRDSALIIGGVRLVSTVPLLGSFKLDEFDGDFFFIPTTQERSDPSFDSIGGNYSLIYLTRSEINELVSTSG
jgi:hypothetical protein